MDEYGYAIEEFSPERNLGENYKFLLDMFDFLFLKEIKNKYGTIKRERKKAYKRRINARVYELRNGIDCTLMEFVYFNALYDLARKEREYVTVGHYNACKFYINGKAMDYQKYIMCWLFGSFDASNYQKKVKELWNSHVESVSRCDGDDYELRFPSADKPSSSGNNKRRVRELPHRDKRKNTGSFVN